MSNLEKKVSFTGVFRNISKMKIEETRYGGEEDHYGFYWRAYAHRLDCMMGLEVPDRLTFGFGCQDWENPNDWKVDVDYALVITSKTGEKKIEKGVESFKKNDTTYVLLTSIEWKDVEKYMVDDTITMECHITIKKVTGVPGFDSREEFSHLFVNVNGEKFSMTKEELISANSPYFISLLDREFEKGKKPEITLRNVNEDDLDQFIDALRGDVNDDNVLGALYVAQNYQAMAVVDKCQKFIETKGNKKTVACIENNLALMKLESEGTTTPLSPATIVELADTSFIETMFEKWNCLSDKLKLHCVNQMDFKTKYLLRGTSHTERRLVNSHKFKIHELNVVDYPSKFYGEFVIKDGGEEYFLDSDDPKYISETLYPLLSFVLQNAEIHWFQSDNFPSATPQMLSKFNNSKPFNTKRVMFLGGNCKQMMWFFKKCNRHSIETIEMCHPEEDKNNFNIDEFMRIPSIGAIKVFIVNDSKSPEIAIKWAEYCMGNYVEIGTQLKFNTQLTGILEQFTEKFKNRIVRHFPNCETQIGVDSTKGILLHLDEVRSIGSLFKMYMFVLSVVPSRMNPEQHTKYSKYNHLAR